ncbi:hypothetical protein Vadar_007459 [Vaccinium darrowii]|uniref:Uncharacterized protein n=1 Tax=Vaccinium darrowii TaxID=229202 RepID=A0ACB7WYI1_9ERIC|nr:hypothetical protein Vadar_007459 [Vaccinium darrowii]
MEFHEHWSGSGIDPNSLDASSRKPNFNNKVINEFQLKVFHSGILSNTFCASSEQSHFPYTSINLFWMYISEENWVLMMQAWTRRVSNADSSSFEKGEELRNWVLMGFIVWS